MSSRWPRFRLFGVQQVDWRINRDFDRYARLKGLSFLPPDPADRSGISVVVQQLDANKHLSPEGRITASITISCACQLRESDVQSVLGATPAITAAYSDASLTHGHPWPVPPLTDPMGNKVLTYDITGSEAYPHTLRTLLDGAGKVREIDITQQEE